MNTNVIYNITLLLSAFTLCFLSCNSHRTLAVEKNGLLIVEAENFDRQDRTSVRQWVRIDQNYNNTYALDPDPNHSDDASGEAYLEALPDTRTTHDEQLIVGENFSNEPGKMAILHYDVHISTPGKYYVWVRTFFTGTEDNGIHVGIDGTWPEHGQRMQWCDGRDTWIWDSKQRTEEVHCGVEKEIYLDITRAGKHTISFSMREDGFEFDQWALSKDYKAPE